MRVIMKGINRSVAVRQLQQKQTGFTLLEVIIVIVAIIILGSVIFFSA
jgi:type II secretory pathway pseudopilin PulG